MAKLLLLASVVLLAGCTLPQRNGVALALCEASSGCTTSDAARDYAGPQHARDMESATARDPNAPE